MAYGIIYKATNKLNDKVYIGQTTKSLDTRIKGHINHCKDITRKYHFTNALRKYNIDDFNWEIICECIDLNDLNEKEIYYIKYFDTLKNGYNSTIGGEGIVGRIVSEEERQRQSERMVGDKNHYYGKKHTAEIRKKISDKLLTTDKHVNRGKSLSEEWKRKIGESQKGKIISKETLENQSRALKGKYVGKDNKLAKKFVITTPEGEEFFVLGLAHFCRNYKNNLLDDRLISKVVSGKRNHHKKHKCRHYNKETDLHIPEYVY